MEWEVWLDDGTARDSSTHTWDDVPDGVLVVRYWGDRSGVNWGDGLYGRPDTYRAAAMVSDEMFARTLATAQSQHTPPSQR